MAFAILHPKDSYPRGLTRRFVAYGTTDADIRQDLVGQLLADGWGGVLGELIPVPNPALQDRLWWMYFDVDSGHDPLPDGAQVTLRVTRGDLSPLRPLGIGDSRNLTFLGADIPDEPIVFPADPGDAQNCTECFAPYGVWAPGGAFQALLTRDSGAAPPPSPVWLKDDFWTAVFYGLGPGNNYHLKIKVTGSGQEEPCSVQTLAFQQCQKETVNVSLTEGQRAPGKAR